MLPKLPSSPIAALVALHQLWWGPDPEPLREHPPSWGCSSAGRGGLSEQAGEADQGEDLLDRKVPFSQSCFPALQSLWADVNNIGELNRSGFYYYIAIVIISKLYGNEIFLACLCSEGNCR